MSAFANLSTTKKLMSAFFLTSAVTAVVGYVGISGMDQVNGMIDTLFSREMRALDLLAEARVASFQVALSARNVIIRPTPEGKADAQKTIDTSAAFFIEEIKAAEKLLVGADQKAVAAEILRNWTDYMKALGVVLQYGHANQTAKANEEAIKVGAISTKLRAQIASLTESKQATAKATRDSSEALFAALRRQLIIAVALASIGAMLVGWIIARMIARPLAASVEVLRKIADGDFTTRLEAESKDEVGQMAAALNDAIVKIRRALTEVSRVSSDVAGAAVQLTASSSEIASGTQTAAASLEQTAASLEEITATVKQNADNAAQADRLAAQSREVAENGGRVVESTVAAMKGISEASNRISEIITTIDEIAFQTNLLALNAAVEAARAGDQGRGFAVVAAEVRNLAQRSATAAKEIKGLIQDTTRKVEEGSAQVSQSGEALREIVQSVKRVTDVIGEIAAGSKEQSTGIEQVNTAVTQVDAVTQSNASQTEELSATAGQLSGQADELQALVARFRIDTEGEEQPVRAVKKPQAQAKRPVTSFPAKQLKGAGKPRGGRAAPSLDEVGEAAGDEHPPAPLPQAAKSEAAGKAGAEAGGFTEF
jgi:methyl-accepting chemotaxis protein